MVWMSHSATAVPAVQRQLLRPDIRRTNIWLMPTRMPVGSPLTNAPLIPSKLNDSPLLGGNAREMKHEA